MEDKEQDEVGAASEVGVRMGRRDLVERALTGFIAPLAGQPWRDHLRLTDAACSCEFETLAGI